VHPNPFSSKPRTSPRATYIAGAGIVKDQLEEMVADESLALIDHYRIVRGALYKGMSAASTQSREESLARKKTHSKLGNFQRETAARLLRFLIQFVRPPKTPGRPPKAMFFRNAVGQFILNF
jgi:hypothetical protein